MILYLNFKLVIWYWQMYKVQTKFPDSTDDSTSRSKWKQKICSSHRIDKSVWHRTATIVNIIQQVCWWKCQNVSSFGLASKDNLKCLWWALGRLLVWPRPGHLCGNQTNGEKSDKQCGILKKTRIFDQCTCGNHIHSDKSAAVVISLW